jgi:LysM repeat protein
MLGGATRRAGAGTAVVCAALLLGPAVLLASCGGEATDEALGTVFTVVPTTYAVIDPPTTTTTTTTTLPPLPPLPDVAGVDASTGTYTVSSGDSVYGIANTFGLTPEQLAAINGWPDGIGHTIVPGDVISVVAGASATAAAPAASGDQQVATGTDAPQANCPTTYTITASDTTRIKVASRFGITYQEMDAANAGTPGYDNFLIGTVINIPCPSV